MSHVGLSVDILHCRCNLDADECACQCRCLSMYDVCDAGAYVKICYWLVAINDNINHILIECRMPTLLI